jgi:hypothetical protein
MPTPLPKQLSPHPVQPVLISKISEMTIKLLNANKSTYSQKNSFWLEYKI